MVSLVWRCAHAVEVFTGFGAPGRRAEEIAGEVAADAARWDAAGVPVGEHFADQLVLLQALAGGGVMRTLSPTLHTRTQIALVPRFLPVAIELEDEGSDRARIRVRA